MAHINDRSQHQLLRIGEGTTNKRCTIARSQVLLGTIAILLSMSNSSTAQFSTFSENWKATEVGRDNLALNIPNLRISGIGSLSQVTDSADRGASANLLAEFNFLEPTFRQRKQGDVIGETRLTNLTKFYLNFNVNADLNTSDRDSLRLSEIYFQDKSRVGFGAGLSTDIMRMITAKKGWSYSIDKIHDKGEGKFDYFRIEPALEYTYSRWNLRSQSLVANADTSLAPDTISTLDRIQTTQWLFGLRCWYTFSSGENAFGFLIYPHVRSQNVSDGTFPLFNGLFYEKSTTGKLSQALTFYGVTIGLQVNKVQFTFTYNELAQQIYINDKDVSGGVFLLKVSVVSDFLEF